LLLSLCTVATTSVRRRHLAAENTARENSKHPIAGEAVVVVVVVVVVVGAAVVVLVKSSIIVQMVDKFQPTSLSGSVEIEVAVVVVVVIVVLVGKTSL
jgi:heme/copper-type cytochrome/quinol oxidase subunit 2